MFASDVQLSDLTLIYLNMCRLTSRLVLRLKSTDVADAGFDIRALAATSKACAVCSETLLLEDEVIRQSFTCRHERHDSLGM